MSQMRGMLAKFSKHMRSSFLSQVPKKKNNLRKLNLLQCVGRKLVVLCSFLAISYERYYVILILCPYYIQDNNDDDFED